MKLLYALESRKFKSPQVVLFFAILTMLVSAVVILVWEQFLMLPFDDWLDTYYTGDTASFSVLSQRIERFIISATAGGLIGTLLLRVATRRRLRLEREA